MKKAFAIILLLVSVNCFGQLNKTYDSIDKVIAFIDNAKFSKKIVLENEEFQNQVTDGGGILEALYINNSLSKIEVNICVLNSIHLKKYYINNDELIYVSESFGTFFYDVANDSFNYSNLENKYLGKFYFSNGKLIDSEITGYNRFLSNEQSINELSLEKNLLEIELVLYKDFNEYLFLIQNNNSKKINLNTSSFMIGDTYTPQTNIQFDFEKHEIKSESFQLLDSIADFLMRHDSLIIEIGVHLDRKHDRYANRIDSKRARSIETYLIEKGIESNRLMCKGYGNTKPLITTEEIDKLNNIEARELAHAKNRRIEFKIVGLR